MDTEKERRGAQAVSEPEVPVGKVEPGRWYSNAAVAILKREFANFRVYSLEEIALRCLAARFEQVGADEEDAGE